jgi:hypothetical protein
MRGHLLLIAVAFCCRAQTTLAVHYRQDISVKNHGIVVTVPGDPQLKTDMSKVLGEPNIDSVAPLLPNGLVVSNLSEKSIGHILVRYIRVERRDGTSVSSDVSLDSNSLEEAVRPGEQMAVLPGDGVIKQKRIGMSPAVNISQLADRYRTMFDPAIFSSAYAFIDPVAFTDGTVVGPDTWGYIDDQNARNAVLTDLRNKVNDLSLTDVSFMSWLQPRSVPVGVGVPGQYGTTVNHLAVQIYSLSLLTLAAMRSYGREYTRVMLEKLYAYQNRVPLKKEN